ncbi:MAG: hypothetical protein ABI760_05525 [Ferruginibacter sp.]
MNTIKKIMLAVILLNLSILLKAQEESDEKSGGFKKENLFTGGNVIASIYTGGTALGVSPHFGYSITSWLDAAVSLNFIYTGERDVDNYKYRQTDLGPGAFVRIFPIDFLFVQAQYEHNFQKLKTIIPDGSSFKLKADVNSLLLGAGFASGREHGNNTYYYFSLMFDALQLENSPYIDSHQRLIPVIRAGFNIGLFQGRRRNF